MGMFDTLYSSYNFGEEFTHIELQTKSLNCFLDNYWISPKGELFSFQYEKCYRMIKSKTNSFGFEWEKTGKNGIVRPYYYTGVVEASNKFNKILINFWIGKVTTYNVLYKNTGVSK